MPDVFFLTQLICALQRLQVELSLSSELAVKYFQAGLDLGYWVTLQHADYHQKEDENEHGIKNVQYNLESSTLLVLDAFPSAGLSSPAWQPAPPPAYPAVCSVHCTVCSTQCAVYSVSYAV